MNTSIGEPANIECEIRVTAGIQPHQRNVGIKPDNDLTVGLDANRQNIGHRISNGRIESRVDAPVGQNACKTMTSASIVGIKTAAYENLAVGLDGDGVN